MSRIQLQVVMGFFALITVILAGAAIARRLGLPASEGAYLMVFVLALLGWVAGRLIQHKGR